MFYRDKHMIVATNMCVSHDNFVVVVFFCRDKIVVVSALANDSVHLSMLPLSCSACDSRRGHAIPLGLKHARAALHYFSYSIT